MNPAKRSSPDPSPLDRLLRIGELPRVKGGTMVLAFSGWMDGGDVSTGTVRRLIDQVGAERFATLDPEPFYILNFPGGMEVTSMFRPSVKIEEGVVQSLEFVSNTFYASPLHKLVLFVGKEPNLHWPTFASAVFEVAKRTGVSRIVFVGSFGGSVPHTREPRLFCTVSDARLLPSLTEVGLRPSGYEGPASFATYLITRAAGEGLDMISLVAEIPGYLQGVNPLSIEAVIRRLAVMLGLRLNTQELRTESTEWEIKVSELVTKDTELSKMVRQLEEQYDDELIGQGGDASTSSGTSE